MEKCEFEYLGPYHIEGVLGRGGMGTVYKGRHSKSGDPVAIKVIAPGVANQMRFRRRFSAEVETLKRLRHPHIVQLIGYGEEQGLLFYSMEFVEGHSLHDHMRQHRKLHWTEVIQVGIEIAAALKHAHDLGIIHRDLKPANLMLTKEGHVKLTDFGIAKLFGSADMTVAGSVIGTADFMPPEQAEGKAVTVRSDLYSLGSVLYALLAGQAPFAGKSVPEVLYAVRYTPAPDSTHVAPDAPTELHALIHETLEKDPLKRPPTALVIGNRLKAIQQGIARLEAERQRTSAIASSTEIVSDKAVAKELTSIDLNDEQDEDLRSTGTESTRERPTAIASDSLLARLVGQQAPIVTRPPNPNSSLSMEVASREAVTLPSELPSVDQPMPSSVSHYTPVSDEDARRFTISSDEPESAQHDWVQYASIAGIVVLLLAAVGVSIYLLQPRSADTLYAEITAVVESGDEGAFVESLGDFEEFVERFPNDVRKEEVQAWIDEAQLARTTRILSRKASKGGADELSAIEQAYLACTQAMGRDVVEAKKKVDAFLSVYRNAKDLSRGDQRLVSLIEYASKSFNKAKLASTPAAASELEALVKAAERNLSKDRLPAFYDSVIELYGDKPWARDVVNRIRALSNK